MAFLCAGCNSGTELANKSKENSKEVYKIQKIQHRFPLKSEMESYLEKEGMVAIHSLDSTIKVDLKYATIDNFTGTVLYDELKEAYLHPIAAEKLVKAQHLLQQYDKNLSLLIYDAVRPLNVQKKMYDTVRNTIFHAYVANPDRTGLHNYGMAVDITICDAEGIALDMGTKFDYFGKAAGINDEENLKKQSILKDNQIENRKLLRKVMIDAGFRTIRGEWWHFNALSLSEARQKAKIVK